LKVEKRLTDGAATREELQRKGGETVEKQEEEEEAEDSHVAS
jgi:hypothetical protein